MGVGPLEPPLGRRTLPVASSPALAAEGGCARPDPAAPLPPARCGDPARRELMKGGPYGVVLALTLARTPCGNPRQIKAAELQGVFLGLISSNFSLPVPRPPPLPPVPTGQSQAEYRQQPRHGFEEEVGGVDEGSKRFDHHSLSRVCCHPWQVAVPPQRTTLSEFLTRDAREGPAAQQHAGGYGAASAHRLAHQRVRRRPVQGGRA